MTPGEDPIAEDAYDQLAGEYAETVETNAYNADLEFPGTTSLVPEVDGKRVLDAGRGTGLYAEWLLDQGADVVAADVSKEMLAHAMERVGDRAEFRRANLGEDLEFAATDSFDGIVSALVLGYVKGWRRTFAEFGRILKPGGFVGFSVMHPMDTLDEEANYFEIERRTKDWSTEVPYYRRPLSEIVNSLVETGFRIDEVAEPQPTDAFEEKRPERYEKESKRPVFLCVRAVRE